MSSIENWYKSAMEIIFHPEDFFSKMPTTSGYSEPLKFALTNLFIANLLGIVFMILSRDTSFQKLSQNLGFEMGAVYTVPILIVVMFIFALIIEVIWIFIGAGITHLFLKLFGAKNGYESTFRVAASVTVFQIIGSVSYFGISGLNFVNTALAIYLIYVLVIGYSKVHKITTLRSLAAVLSPVLILFVFVIILVIIYIQTLSGPEVIPFPYANSRGICGHGAFGFPIVNALTIYHDEYQVYEDGSAVVTVRNNHDRSVILRGISANGIPVTDIHQTIGPAESYIIPSTTMVPGTFLMGKEDGCYNSKVIINYDVVGRIENMICSGTLAGKYY